MARDFADKSTARQWVWDRLSAEGVARFPFPPHGRIPNFAGAEVAATRLLDIEPWKSATAIKVNPDSPQRPLRAEALRRGITVFVPTPRLRGGFKKLDPRRIPPDKIEARRLVERGARTLLWHEAALGLMLAIVQRVEADPPPRPEEISGAFWNACHGGQLAAAQYLLAHGADLDWSAPWSGQTPLDIAEQAGRADVVAWLTETGATRGKQSA